MCSVEIPTNAKLPAFETKYSRSGFVSHITLPNTKRERKPRNGISWLKELQIKNWFKYEIHELMRQTKQSNFLAGIQNQDLICIIGLSIFWITEYLITQVFADSNFECCIDYAMWLFQNINPAIIRIACCCNCICKSSWSFKQSQIKVWAGLSHWFFDPSKGLRLDLSEKSPCSHHRSGVELWQIQIQISYLSLAIFVCGDTTVVLTMTNTEIVYRYCICPLPYLSEKLVSFCWAWCWSAVTNDVQSKVLSAISNNSNFNHFRKKIEDCLHQS